MKYYSTNRGVQPVNLREAVLCGLAADGGLFMPERIPFFPKGYVESLDGQSFMEIAFEMSLLFLRDEVPEGVVQDMVTKAFSFDAPVRFVEPKVSVLELFHGPTLAFKDFGARFMAQLMSYFLRNEDKELNILVATSGDTGSAVASGFLKVPGIKVTILYPSGRVSDIQEKQLTTLGENITAIEVQGTFDDCQRLVKKAFVDGNLKQCQRLGSANSINIARLIPQSFYYVSAYAQSGINKVDVFCVPSGNFGNLTAGLIAKHMGLPIRKLVAATNINKVFPEYLEKGDYKPQESLSTISNAMDVGNPSNFARMLELYQRDVDRMREDVASFSISEDQTRKAIRDVFNERGYILDPHGAVGYAALKRYMSGNIVANGIFLETAHPAKFIETVEREVGNVVPMPTRLATFLDKAKRSVLIPNSYDCCREILLKQ